MSGLSMDRENKREVPIKKDPIWDTIGVLELEEDASEREDRDNLS